MWVASLPPASPFSNPESNGGPRGRGWGRGRAKQSGEKTSRFVDRSKKRLRSPPFPAFNLITAPHSLDRSGLQSELFTSSSFCHRFPPPQTPAAPAWRPLPLAGV